MREIVIFVQAAILAACASAPSQPTVIREPVEVAIAVPVPCAAPAELLAPIDLEPPTFIATCPPATSGLDAEGERRLMELLWAHRTRLDAWIAHDVECRK